MVYHKMPTLNPRVNVTLSPSLDVLVGQLAGFERVSKSMVLRELLEAAEPALRQAVVLMEAAKGASVNARKKLANDLDKNLLDAEQIAFDQLQIIANHTRDIVGEAEAIKGRRPPRAKPAAAVVAGPGKALVQAYADTNGVPPRRSLQLVKRPPSSNRGVKS
jgi:hypothetical protein